MEERTMEQLQNELKSYIDTGYTPEQIRDMAFLYREKCQEVAKLRIQIREMEND